MWAQYYLVILSLLLSAGTGFRIKPTTQGDDMNTSTMEPGGDIGSTKIKMKLWIWLSVASGGLLILILAAYLAVRIRRNMSTVFHRRHTNSHAVTSIIGQFRSGVTQQQPMSVLRRSNPNQYERDSHVSRVSTNTTSKMINYMALTHPYDAQRYDVPLGSLQVDESQVLGSGEFGVVFMGFLTTTGTTRAANQVQVAVKKLKTTKKGADPGAVGAFLKELQIMSFVGTHVNLVQLLGACTRVTTVEDMAMVLGLCSNGNLEKYLRARRSVFVKCVCVYVDASPPPKYVDASTLKLTPLSPITYQHLLRFAVEIAAGMEFLAEKKVVHGDLATRNVLLDENLTVKISDFGLAGKLYEYTRLTQKEGKPLPWRWMALEAIRDLEFSSASDVWSFGITAWEIFTLAELPYPGLVWGDKFIRQLEAGHRNGKPKYATDELFAIISRCWEVEPSKRPSMTEIRQLFAKMTAC